MTYAMWGSLGQDGDSLRPAGQHPVKGLGVLWMFSKPDTSTL